MHSSNPAALTLLTILGLTVLWACAPASGESNPERKVPGPTFEGNSTLLERTAVVPTLDTGGVAGKNRIWCASFQLAWNALKDDVIGEPIRIENAEEVARRLNEAKVAVTDLPPDSFLARAGVVSTELVESIRREMAKRFPSAPAPAIDGPPGSLLAYACMAESVTFRLPYFENDQALAFRESTGRRANVTSFGIREKDDYAYYKLRSQVDVLYEKNIYGHESDRPSEFIVDLDRKSRPAQLILACVPPEATLAATVAKVNEKIAGAEKELGYRPDMGPNDVLLVPDLHVRILHHFKELEGRDKVVRNEKYDGYWVDKAVQSIEFKLDKSGADLRSEAKLMCLPVPAHYVFDRPFLILMRGRGSATPFFAMWVDNAELLRPSGK